MNNHLTSGYTAKKRFGQNFLTDEYVIGEIIRIIAPSSKDSMVEIGPGLGALTKPLLEYLDRLDVIELDRDIVVYLKEQFAQNSKLIIHSADALKFDYNSLTSPPRHPQDKSADATPEKGNCMRSLRIRIVGNLPYNISTPLLFYLTGFNNILDMHFMLQKEVVERICATPHTKDYGRLSVMLQCRYSCSNLLAVNRDAFSPSPQVDSAIVRLAPKDPLHVQSINIGKLNFIVTNAFNKRRKTISNSLKGIIASDILTMLGIDGQKRAENLTVEDYVALANSI